MIKSEETRDTRHIDEKGERTIGAFEAKTHFSALLERANRGEEIVITRRGEPFAKIGPVTHRHDPEKARAVIARIRERNRRNPIGPITPEEIKSWINEGRRY